jgi:hypothetical protein
MCRTIAGGTAVRARLFRDLHQAVKVADLAKENFVAATNALKGIPHPDGKLHIQTVSRQLTAARMGMLQAQLSE